MSFPVPPYTEVGLEAFLAATPVDLPLPPGPPGDWTTLFHRIGPKHLLARADAPLHGTDIFDRALLTALLEAAGRPTREEERMPFLLASPIPKSFDVVAALRGLVQNASGYAVRWRAALALGLLGSAADIPTLVRALGDSDNDVRRGATEALSRVGDAKILSKLLPESWDSDDSVNSARLDAVTRLDAWGAAGALLEESEENEARDVGLALAAGGSDLSEALSTVTDSDLRVAVLRYLEAHPATAGACIERISEFALEESADIARTAAARALGAAGEEGLEVMLDLCDSPDWGKRMIGIAGIAFAGPDLAAATGPAIEARLSDDDNDVVRDAHLAAHAVLGRALPADLQWTSSYDFLSRLLALGQSTTHRILEGSEAPGLALLATLASGGNGSEKPLTMVAFLAACAFPDAAAPTLEALARDLPRSVNMELRRGAAAALMLTGRAPTTMGALYRILLCHQGGTTEPVGGAIGNLADHADELGVLITPFDGDWAVRIDAVRLLGRLGAVAEPFGPLLEHVATMDSDSDVRREARAARGAVWSTRNLPDALASVIAPYRQANSEDRLTALAQVQAEAPALAGQLAATLSSSTDRDIARRTSVMVGESLSGASLAHAVQGALGRLTNSSWVTREAACDLLGAARGIEDDLLEEVVDGLRTRISDDSDSDVQNAAKAALLALGFEE